MKRIKQTKEIEGLVNLAYSSPYTNKKGDVWYSPSPRPLVSLKSWEDEKPVFVSSYEDAVKAYMLWITYDNREHDLATCIKYKDLEFVYSPKFGFFVKEENCDIYNQ